MGFSGAKHVVRATPSDCFAALFQKRAPARRERKNALFLFATGVPRNERSRVFGGRGAFSFGAAYSKEKALKDYDIYG